MSSPPFIIPTTPPFHVVILTYNRSPLALVYRRHWDEGKFIILGGLLAFTLLIKAIKEVLFLNRTSTTRATSSTAFANTIT